MPSQKKNNTKKHVKHSISLFILLVTIVFVAWGLYRALFDFPVWFDEVIGKALFFGLPVWIFITTSGFSGLFESMRPGKFRQGILQGVAFGGVFGFVAAITSLVARDSLVVPTPLFTQGIFWTEFALAIFTGFWESIFFYGFIMAFLLATWPKWTLFKQVLIAASIFTIFHAPNVLVEFPGITSFMGYMILIGFFGIGQAFLFSRNKNVYTLIVVHAIWGLTLLIHTM